MSEDIKPPETETNPSAVVSGDSTNAEIPPESTPEPNPRHYINHSFGFDFVRENDKTFIQGSYYKVPNGLDIDGLFGNKIYNSTDDLIKVAGFTQEEAQLVVSRISQFRTKRI